MKKQLFFATTALCCGLLASFSANAQDAVVVEEESVSVVDVTGQRIFPVGKQWLQE